MSKDYYEFEKEKGDIGFIAGVVDVLSDNLSLMCDFANAMEADIFFAENNDFSELNKSIKYRLHNYNNNNFSVFKDKIEKEIESMNISFEDYEKTSIDAINKMFAKYSSNSKLDEEINEFLTSLNWYLGKPICCYIPKRKNNKYASIFGKIYLYTAWDYLFINYDSFFVLMVFGTVE